MNIQLSKDTCNKHYLHVLKQFEAFADITDICKNLLDIASMLIEIGKISFVDKAKCDAQAKRLLGAAKKLRETKDHGRVYFDLTGDLLVEPISKQIEEVEKDIFAKKPDQNIDNITKKDFFADENVQNSSASTEQLKEIIDQKRAEEDIVDESVPAGFQFDWNKIPSISFDDVAGLDEVKKAVVRKVLLPLANPELFDGFVKQNGGGLLLYGPPGTGKTMIAAAIAHEIGAKFCSIGASDLVLGGIGNAEKAIVNLFKEARSFKCAVIFFDEIESICPVSTKAQHAKQIRSELLRQIQGLDNYRKEEDKILFLIAATNKPWEIDPAFVRPGRFGTRVYVGLPDDEARQYMIESRLNKIKNKGIVSINDDIDVEYIVKSTQGFNGADVGNLLDEVQEIAIMRAAIGEQKTISQADFIKAFEKVTSSVQQKDLQRLEDWKEENG